MNEISSINKEKCIEELTCPICLDILQDPVMELPNQHIMCRKCLLNFNETLKKYNRKNLDSTCPFCKEKIIQLIKPRIIITLLNLVEMKCMSESK